MLAVLLDPRQRRTSTNNNADHDSDEASFEEIKATEQEATVSTLQTASADDMYEYQCASNFVNMHYAYKSSINEGLCNYGNNSSDYDSDDNDEDTYNYYYYDCEDEVADYEDEVADYVGDYEDT